MIINGNKIKDQKLFANKFYQYFYSKFTGYQLSCFDTLIKYNSCLYGISSDIIKNVNDSLKRTISAGHDGFLTIFG